MDTPRRGPLHVVTAVVTGLTALSAYAGVVGLIGGGISFGAGVALVAWIGIELAFIQVYSWFHPVYLALAVLVLVLGWLLARQPTASLVPT
jgi:hypothetical protein